MIARVEYYNYNQAPLENMPTLDPHTNVCVFFKAQRLSSLLSDVRQ